MRLNPFRFTASIGLFLTLSAVLFTCTSHVNQALTASQLIGTALAANPETTTSIHPFSGVELQWMGGSSSEVDHEWPNSLVDAFNAEYKDRQPNVTLLPGYDERIQTNLAGGNWPDRFYSESLHLPDFITDGSWELYESRTFDPNDFDASLQRTFDCPSKDFSSVALVHYGRMVTEAGLQLPSADWAWDDLRKAAKALTHKDTDAYGLSLSSKPAHQIESISQVGFAAKSTHMGRQAW